mgnify:CR=1 FL=1
MNGSRTFAVILVILALIGLAFFSAYRYNDGGAVSGTSYGSEMRNDAKDFGGDVEDKAKDVRDSVDGKDAGDHLKDWGRNTQDVGRDAGDKIEDKVDDLRK